MSQITLIAAMSADRVIGLKGQLPWRCPEDLQHFRRCTLGKPVIMGRVTFEGLPGPLPERRSLVLSRGLGPSEGVEVCGSLDEALARTRGASEVMIIGGQAVYEAAMPRASALILTIIEGSYEGDRWFPSLDAGWIRGRVTPLRSGMGRVERWGR